MKRYSFLLIISVLLFYGCGQPAHKSNVLSGSGINNAGIDDKKSYSGSGGESGENNNKTEYSGGPGLNYCDPGASNKINGGSATDVPALDEALDFCQLSQEFWQKGELEKAIEALDQAYTLILSVDENDPKIIQQKEDIRFMISKRILEIYASRNVVVKGNFSEIPLTINQHVQSEINLFTKGIEADFFIESYKRSGRYRRLIASELKDAGLPEELSWLPLIESGFKVNALSTARALGLWQFIPSTGYRFGLSRDKYIDERLDPIKSTKSAILYLKELHQMFGDWSTALAGYNCGEQRVLQVIRSQNVNYLDNFWDLYERLPRETARYVPRFLATLHIVKNPSKFGITLPQVEDELYYETISVSKQVNLKDIATKINIPEIELKMLNPELRYNILPDDDYQLRVPPQKSELVLASIDTIPMSCPPAPPQKPVYVYHKVKSGETLSIIANRYRTSVDTIMSVNKLRSSNRIAKGRLLKIPSRGAVGYEPEKAEKVYAPKKKPYTYAVKSGDSLWNLANRFGTTTKKIQVLNNLSGTNLTIGQVLKIPGYSAKSLASSQRVYVVKKGDTPNIIAKKHKMALSQFLSLNRLTQKCKIYPGQQVFVD